MTKKKTKNQHAKKTRTPGMVFMLCAKGTE